MTSERDQRQIAVNAAEAERQIAITARLAAEEANRQKDRAERMASTERGVRAQLLAAQPGMELDALVLAVQAVGDRLGKPEEAGPEAWAGLFASARAFDRARIVTEQLPGHSLYTVRLTPDASRVVTTTYEGARIFDSRTLAPTAALGEDGGCLISEDAERALVIDGDSSRIFETREGAPLATLRGNSAVWRGGFLVGAFSPNNEIVATAGSEPLAHIFPPSASADPTIICWSSQTGEEVRRLTGHTRTVNALVFLGETRRLASAADDGTVRLWDTEQGLCLAVLEAGKGRIGVISVDREGARVAACSGELDDAEQAHRTIRVWDVASYSLLWELRGHRKPVSTIALSPDGQRLVSGDSEGTIILWNVSDGTIASQASGHVGGVRCIDFGSDGQTFASGGKDRTVRLWDMQAIPRQAWQGFDGPVTSVDLHTATRSIAACDSSSARLLRTDPDDSQASLSLAPMLPWTVVGSDAGPLVVARNPEQADASTVVWALDGSRPIATLATTGSCLYSGTGAMVPTVLIAEPEGSGRVVNLMDGRFGGKFHGVPPYHEPTALVSLEILTGVFGVSPDGTRIALVGSDHVVHIHDAETGREQASSTPPERPLALAWNPRGDRVLILCAGGIAHVADAATGKILASLRPIDKQSEFGRASWSPDGRWIYTEGYSCADEVWDAETGQLACTLADHKQTWMARFTPDGAGLLCAGEHNLYYHNARSGALIWEAEVPDAKHLTSAITADGRWVASADARGAIHIRDLATGTQIADLRGHSGRVHRLWYAPDGRLISLSDDFTVRTWNASPDRLLRMEFPLDAPTWRHVVETIGLSPQQARIVELILRGMRDKEVASERARRVPSGTPLGSLLECLNKLAERDAID